MYLLSRWDIIPGIDRAIENVINSIFTEFPIIKYLFIGIMALGAIFVISEEIMGMFEK